MKRNVYVVVLLVLAIFFFVIGVVRNLKKGEAINPVEDIREYDQMHESLMDNEIPELVLNNSQELIDEFKKKIENGNVEDFYIAKIQTIFGDDGNYRTAYLVINAVKNTKVAKIFLFYNKDGGIVRVKMEFNGQKEEIILFYNKSLLDLSSLGISEGDKQKIQDGLKNNFEKGWSFDNIYTYENIPTSNLKIINLYSL